jgi:trehalose/maltose hydrolase-like predicted phosphorylase
MDKGSELGDVIVSELKAINDEQQQQQQQQVFARSNGHLGMTNTTRGAAP